MWDLWASLDTDGTQWPVLDGFDGRAGGYFSIRQHWTGCTPEISINVSVISAHNSLLPDEYSNLPRYSVFTEERQSFLGKIYINRARHWCCCCFPCSRVTQASNLKFGNLFGLHRMLRLPWETLIWLLSCQVYDESRRTSDRNVKNGYFKVGPISEKILSVNTGLWWKTPHVSLLPTLLSR